LNVRNKRKEVIMKSKTLGVLFISAATLALGMPTIASAGAESGLYIGGGAGDAMVKGGTVDGDELGYKVFAGFNFGVVPLLDLAVEVSYVDMYNATAINALGLLGVNLGPIGLFAKVGMADVNLDRSVGPDDSSVDPVYGVGAKLQFSSLGVRAEYEEYDTDGADLSMVSVSAVWTF
jgi:outer membrane immunogenic protein